MRRPTVLPALLLLVPVLCGGALAPRSGAAAAPAPPAPAAVRAAVATGPTSVGGIVEVTIPAVLRVDVLSQQVSAAGCQVVVAVTDTRAGRPGFTLVASGGGRGALHAVQVPGNGMLARDVEVTGGSAVYPAGLGIGSVRVAGTFETCPAWTLG